MIHYLQECSTFFPKVLLKYGAITKTFRMGCPPGLVLSNLHVSSTGCTAHRIYERDLLRVGGGYPPLCHTRDGNPGYTHKYIRNIYCRVAHDVLHQQA